MTNSEGRAPGRETLQILVRKARERGALLLDHARVASIRVRSYYAAKDQPAVDRELRLFKSDLTVLGSCLSERIATLRERRASSTRPTRRRSLGGFIRGAFYLGVAGSVMFAISGTIAYQSIASDFVPPEQMGVNRP